jgi:nucleotide-binding universal stress UspA family protein
MSNKAQVLFPTDFSEASRHALPYAVRLSMALGAELHLLHAEVLHDIGHETDEDFPDLYDLLRAANLKTGRTFEALQTGLEADLDVHEAQRRGVSAAAVILEYAQEKEIELIVMASQGRSGIDRLVLGSVAAEVVRRAPMPVLTIPKAWQATDLPALIAASYDLTEIGARVLDYAQTFCQLTNADLDVLHVVDMPTSLAIYEALPEIPTEAIDRAEDEARARIEAAIAATDLEPNKTSVRIMRGPVRQALIEYLDAHQPDLLIQGSHGYRGFRRFVLGSVAESTVNHAICPVLTVKVIDA